MANGDKNNNSDLLNTYFENIFTFAGIGIITLNSQNYIEFANKEALKIFGYTTIEVINTKFSSLIHSKDQKNFSIHIQSNKIFSPLKLIAIHKDNSSFPVEINISRNLIDKNVIYTVVIHDITK